MYRPITGCGCRARIRCISSACGLLDHSLEPNISVNSAFGVSSIGRMILAGKCDILVALLLLLLRGDSLHVTCNSIRILPWSAVFHCILVYCARLEYRSVYCCSLLVGCRSSRMGGLYVEVGECCFGVPGIFMIWFSCGLIGLRRCRLVYCVQHICSRLHCIEKRLWRGYPCCNRTIFWILVLVVLVAL